MGEDSRGWTRGRRSKDAPAGLSIEQAFRTEAEESPEPLHFHMSNKRDPQSAKAYVIEYNPKVQFPWRASALGASRAGCIGWAETTLATRLDSVDDLYCDQRHRETGAKPLAPPQRATATGR